MFAAERNGWQDKKDGSDENFFTLNWFEGEILQKKLYDIFLETSNVDEEGQEEVLEEEIDNESEEKEYTEEEAAEDNDLPTDD